jgi:hypothetical protein
MITQEHFQNANNKASKTVLDEKPTKKLGIMFSSPIFVGFLSKVDQNLQSWTNEKQK